MCGGSLFVYCLDDCVGEIVEFGVGVFDVDCCDDDGEEDYIEVDGNVEGYDVVV